MTGEEIINKVLDELKIKAPTFAEQIGVLYQRIFDIQRGKTKKISSQLANAIIKIYPQFNLQWLLTGEGEMLKSGTQTKIEPNAHPVINPNFMNVPLIPVRAQCGYLNGYGDQEYIDTLPTLPVIVDRTYHGKYRLFEAEGDSMDDNTRNAICDGDIVLGREVQRHLWASKLHMNDWYFIIVHRTEGISIKQIIDHDVEHGIITCHPLNDLFHDYKVYLDEVAELYNVIKIVDRSARL